MSTFDLPIFLTKMVLDKLFFRNLFHFEFKTSMKEIASFKDLWMQVISIVLLSFITKRKSLLEKKSFEYSLKMLNLILKCFHWQIFFSFWLTKFRLLSVGWFQRFFIINNNYTVIFSFPLFIVALHTIDQSHIRMCCLVFYLSQPLPSLLIPHLH